MAGLLASAPVIGDLGALFAAAGHEIALVGGSVRDVLLGRTIDDFDFATSARPEDTEELMRELGRRALDPRAGVRHHRRAQAQPASGDHDIPQRRLRPRVPQAAGGLRRLTDRRPVAPGLHHQRDGGVPAGIDVRRPVRRSERSRGPDAAHPRHPGAVVHRRPAADAACRAVRRVSSASRWIPASWTRCPRCPSGSRSCRPSGYGTSSSSWSCLHIPRSVCSCWSVPAWPNRSFPSCRPCAWNGTSTTGTRTCTNTRSPCWSGGRAGVAAARRRPRPRHQAGRPAARHRQAADPALRAAVDL